jgi:Pyridoxamine 5'-phosphate oxidase
LLAFSPVKHGIPCADLAPVIHSHERRADHMKQAQVTEVVNDPLAQELLNSNIPARLAYTGVDGFPRAIPVGFLWDGTRFVIGTATNSPKMQALRANPKVALTIDTNTFPPHVLLVRGAARVEIVDGVAPEYLEGSKKYVAPEQWEALQSMTMPRCWPWI